ncbi:hypothetical protein V6N11_065394 [Hibiscus sabdariffa]|uniref:CCHC-type domain-containing protein n=1 Tax=Hibiscus sabdariffa TaxID=183260 RepID=A0ABR2AA92_9ROSI
MSAVTDGLSDLSLGEEDEIAIAVDDASDEQTITFDLCFGGSFLTNSIINFQSMRATLANVWHPIGGIAVSDLGSGRYLFRFYYTVDVDRIEMDGPWYFNSHLLVLHGLQSGEDLLGVNLQTVDFWVLIHDIPSGFVRESVAKQLGNFIGTYLYYDTQALTLGFRGFMRIRVRLDIRSPLKRRKKLLLPTGQSGFVSFQYEKLKLLCYRCGKLGHGEGFCPLRVLQEQDEGIRVKSGTAYQPISNPNNSAQLIPSPAVGIIVSRGKIMEHLGRSGKVFHGPSASLGLGFGQPSGSRGRAFLIYSP